MDKNDYEVFAQTYKKVETICTEILERLAYKPDENRNINEYMIPFEFPEYESLIVKDNGDVEFAWYEDDTGLGRDVDEGTLVIPKDVFINENVDEWCKIAVIEHKRHLEELERQRLARKEADERKLYEELKKKYG
jgi:hypothetical protein